MNHNVTVMHGWVAMVVALALVLGGCPTPTPPCNRPSVMYMGRCLPPCVENGIDYCASPDGSVVFPPEASVDVMSDVDAVADAVGGDIADVIDVAPACPVPGQQRCMGVCVDTISNVDHCGRCGMSCPNAMNGAPACVMGACTLRCAMGFQLVGNACVTENTAPRQIAPLSLGDVTLRRPTLRWELRGGFDGATVELCRDRACTMVIETIRAMGSSARPTVALPARSVVFWRVRGRVGMAESAVNSATWLFHVPVMDASSGVDTSFHAHNDVNGDGYDDVVVGSPGASPAGRRNAGQVSVFLGAAGGLSGVPTLVLEGVMPSDRMGDVVAGAGDLNGDGFGDLVSGSAAPTRGGAGDSGSASVFLGSGDGLVPMPATVLDGSLSEGFATSVASAGDVNGDGYADLLIGAALGRVGGARTGIVRLYSGGATGLVPVPQRTLSGAVAEDRFGSSCAGAGDVNGDGFGDVIVGADYADVMAQMDVGRASCFLGAASGLQEIPTWTFEGTQPFRSQVTRVASGGDVNGDGYSDVLVGSRPLETVSIFHGNAMGVERVARTLVGPPGQGFGGSVSGAGDVNNDGFGDVVVGAAGASPMGQIGAGSALVFHGSAGGVLMGVVRTLDGTAAGDAFGTHVGSVGDINGDGFGDVAIGAPRTVMFQGTATVFYGTVVGINSGVSIMLRGRANQDEFGTSVAHWQRMGAQTGDRRWLWLPSSTRPVRSFSPIPAQSL